MEWEGSQPDHEITKEQGTRLSEMQQSAEVESTKEEWPGATSKTARAAQMAAAAKDASLTFCIAIHGSPKPLNGRYPSDSPPQRRDAARNASHLLAL